MGKTEAPTREVLAKINVVRFHNTARLILDVIVNIENGPNGVRLCSLTLDSITKGKGKNPDKTEGTVYGCELLRQFVAIFGNFDSVQGSIIYVKLDADNNPTGFRTLEINGPVQSMDFPALKESYVK